MVELRELSLKILLARMSSGLERWTGDRTVRGSNPTAENFSLRNFGNSIYPALPVIIIIIFVLPSERRVHR